MKETTKKKRELANIVSAERILRKCGYDAGREQVVAETADILTQHLAIHVIDTMKNKGFDQPKLYADTESREYAKCIQPLHPTYDPNDYESIQTNYEKY